MVNAILKVENANATQLKNQSLPSKVKCGLVTIARQKAAQMNAAGKVHVLKVHANVKRDGLVQIAALQHAIKNVGSMDVV